MTGVAVNVTWVPVQTGFMEAEMVTLAGKGFITVIVTGFDMTGFEIGQGMLEVTWHFTTSPVMVGVYE